MPSPNPTTRREFKGAAAATTLQNSMSNSDTSFVLVAASNWPTGAVGKFVVTINRGQADEEKILCDTQTSRTVACQLSNRGFDGTTAQAHAAGATVECTISAFDADEWNQHTNATSGVHGVAGSVVGTTDTQTLTNKTLMAPAISSPTVSGTVTETGVHSPDTAAHVGLTIKGLSSQSGDYQQVQNNSGTPLLRVRSDGTLIAGMGATALNGAIEADLRNASSQAYGVFVTMNAAQSSAPISVQTSTGTLVFSVDASGNVSAANLTPAWTSYTPTFTNITSPTGFFAYRLQGKTLSIRGVFTGGSVTATGAVTVSLPASLSVPASATQIVGYDQSLNTQWYVATSGTTVTAGSVAGGTSLNQAGKLTGFNAVIEVA